MCRAWLLRGSKDKWQKESEMLYIKSNKSRAVIDLSGIWQFKLDDGTGFENNWMARPLEYADNLYVPASYND